MVSSRQVERLGWTQRSLTSGSGLSLQIVNNVLNYFFYLFQDFVDHLVLLKVLSRLEKVIAFTASC